MPRFTYDIIIENEPEQRYLLILECTTEDQHSAIAKLDPLLIQGISTALAQAGRCLVPLLSGIAVEPLT